MWFNFAAQECFMRHLVKKVCFRNAHDMFPEQAIVSSETNRLNTQANREYTCGQARDWHYRKLDQLLNSEATLN